VKSDQKTFNFVKNVKFNVFFNSTFTKTTFLSIFTFLAFKKLTLTFFTPTVLFSSVYSRATLDDDSIATRLSPAASTTVSVYWLEQRRRQQTSCNASSTQLHESYRTAASTTEVWLSSGARARLYTGLTSPTGSSSGCASKCTSVSMQYMAPGYLSELCKPVANIDGHRRRAFCYAGPSAWNALPDFKKHYTFSTYF